MFRKAHFKVSRKDDNWDCEVTPVFDVEEIKRGYSEGLDFDEIERFLDGETDEAEGEVNWAGSGSGVVLKMKEGTFMPVGFRDSGAPTHAEKLCTASGVADDVEELLEPRLLSIKELEEIMMYDTSEDEWLLPVENTYFERPMAPALKRTASEWEQNSPSVLSYDTTRVEARFREIGSDRLKINHPKRSDTENSITGHLVLDRETRNLDLVDIVEIDISDRSIEDVKFFDGERVDGRLLDRPIFMFKPDEYMTLFNDDKTVAHRKMLSGLYYDGDGYSSSYADGVEIEEEFDGVPTLLDSHDKICKYVEENY